jgi:hypothetical protein
MASEQPDFSALARYFCSPWLDFIHPSIVGYSQAYHATTWGAHDKLTPHQK